MINEFMYEKESYRLCEPIIKDAERILIEESSDNSRLMVKVDNKGNFLSANAYYCELFGVKKKNYSANHLYRY